MSVDDSKLVDWTVFQRARSELGAGFVRILGYFREDGVKSVAAIEAALRAKSAAAMVIPAHTLKGESRQFGAEPLAKPALVAPGQSVCTGEEASEIIDRIYPQAREGAPAPAPVDRGPRRTPTRNDYLALGVEPETLDRMGI